MAKEQELCLPVLDELVKDYANGVESQATGPWQQCDAMRQALHAGDVDRGLAIMREVCPAALEDVRLVFRAKKQKFVELLRTGGDPEAALACARAELAPLALDAYPEAYVEFKRLLPLLLLVSPLDPQRNQQQQQHQQTQQQDRSGTLTQGGALGAAGGSGGGGRGGGGGGGDAFCGVDTSGLWDPGSTAEFADLAFFTVRSMLGLQQSLLSLQLRFLLRLHGSHPAAVSTPGGTAAAELAPRLRAAGGGPDRDPPPLPPLTAPGQGGGGGRGGGVGVGGPPSFPESGVQAVIHGAGTSRQAAMDALKRAGGDALRAFKAEVGRLRLNERLLADLALEYGRFRGLLSVQQAAALEARAAGVGGKLAADEPSAAAADQSRPQLLEPPHLPLPPPQHQQQQHPQGDQPSAQGAQQQQQGPSTRIAAGPGRPCAGAGPGPLGLARGDASRGGSSPPSKLARRSPPAEEGATDGDNDGGAGGQQEQRDVEMGLSGSGRPLAAVAVTGNGEAAAAAAADRAAGSAAAPSSESGSRSEGGSGSGSGSGSGASKPQLRGQEVLSALLQLGRDGDAAGVKSLVEAVDPGLWAEHPHLLFDVHRCQYGKLLAEGEVTAALELARRELTPLANATPALLPLLKSAMAALLPPLPGAEPMAGPAPLAPRPTPPLFRSFLPPVPGAQPPPPPPPLPSAASSSSAPTASLSGSVSASGCSSSFSLLPSLPVVVGAIQAVLQPRLGLRGPRLIRLMEGLLASHRAWMRAEKMSSDPFAEPMRISSLRAAPAGTAAAAAAAAAPSQAPRQPTGAAGALAPLPPPPPPLPPGRGTELGVAARALERALREAGSERERGLLMPWFEMEQQILAQMQIPFGRDVPPPPPPPGGHGPLYAAFAGLTGNRFPDLMAGEEEEEGDGAGAGGVAAGDDDDDDDDSGGGGGGGMDVDEEGVLRLMEILELPRGAAVELLQDHDGDVQAAVLSIMGG